MAKRCKEEEEPRRVRPRGPTSVQGPRHVPTTFGHLPRGSAGSPAVWRSVVPPDQQQQAAERDAAYEMAESTAVQSMQVCMHPYEYRLR